MEEVEDTPVTEGPKLNEVVERYIALRDKKAEHKKAYEAKVEAIEAALDKLEAYIMTKLEQQGLDSVKTGVGTAYKSTRTSATVADWPMVLDWIKEKEEWDMLEKRVNKTFVEAFRTEYDDLPPGVNWREEKVINIRRS